MNEDLVLKLCSKNAEILILEERCKKLREALEFYAEIGHWGVHTSTGNTSIDPCDYEDMRGGKRAREVLKEIGNL